MYAIWVVFLERFSTQFSYDLLQHYGKKNTLGVYPCGMANKWSYLITTTRSTNTYLLTNTTSNENNC